LNKFQEELQKVAGTLGLGVSFQMPHNGIGSGNFSVKRQQKIFAYWEQEKTKIAKNIKEHKIAGAREKACTGEANTTASYFKTSGLAVRLSFLDELSSSLLTFILWITASCPASFNAFFSFFSYR